MGRHAHGCHVTVPSSCQLLSLASIGGLVCAAREQHEQARSLAALGRRRSWRCRYRRSRLGLLCSRRGCGWRPGRGCRQRGHRSPHEALRLRRPPTLGERAAAGATVWPHWRRPCGCPQHGGQGALRGRRGRGRQWLREERHRVVNGYPSGPGRVDACLVLPSGVSLPPILKPHLVTSVRVNQ